MLWNWIFQIGNSCFSYEMMTFQHWKLRLAILFFFVHNTNYSKYLSVLMKNTCLCRQCRHKYVDDLEYFLRHNSIKIITILTFAKENRIKEPLMWRTCFPNSAWIITIFWRDCYRFVNHHFLNSCCQHIDAVLLGCKLNLKFDLKDSILFKIHVCVEMEMFLRANVTRKRKKTITGETTRLVRLNNRSVFVQSLCELHISTSNSVYVLTLMWFFSLLAWTSCKPITPSGVLFAFNACSVTIHT